MISPFIIKPNNYTPKQYGKNGQIEYGWSNNIKEWIPQFYYQLTRTNETTIESLESMLRDKLYYIINTLRMNIDIDKQLKEEYVHYLVLLYKIVGNTRDIINGKGERTLTYMMITVWYDFFPELAFFALNTFVYSPLNTNAHSYGSWKDMKYFCNYVKKKMNNEEHPLIKECVKIINLQLLFDDQTNININDNISLVSKWIPREKSKKFGWMFSYLAYDYFKHYIQSANTFTSIINSKLKCKTSYRQLVSKLNKTLNTVQINQCSKQWSKIDFEKVTSTSLYKNNKSFLNHNEIPDIDRLTCEENFKNFILKSKLEESSLSTSTSINQFFINKNKIKGNQIGLNEFTKSALNIIKEKNKNNGIYSEKLLYEKELLNLQWNHHSLNTDFLGNIIPIIDLSSSMSGESLYSAIALGIRVAEKSSLHKRIMIVSSYPIWIYLENKDNFVDYVEEIIKYCFEENANIDSVFNLILHAIIESKMELELVNNMTFILFSDMQFVNNNLDNKSSIYDKIKEKYLKKLPKIHHIVFWNLSSTNGFPNLSFQKNISMLSGFHSSLLNLYSKKGVKCLNECNPISRIEQILMNKRYTILENKVLEILQLYNIFV